MFSQLFGSEKKLVPSYFEPDKHCLQLFLEREKKWIPAIWRPKNVVHKLLGARKKDYDIYLKSEKLVHSQQEHEKSVSQLFGSEKNWFPSYFEPDKHCCSYLEREKSGSLLFGDQKNVVHNCQDQGKRL